MRLEITRWTEGNEPDAAVLRQRLEAEGYSVCEWVDAPGTSYSPHSHAEDQSHWIVSGILELTVAGNRYTLGPGDRDFLPAKTTHSAYVPGDDPVHYLIGARGER